METMKMIIAIIGLSVTLWAFGQSFVEIQSDNTGTYRALSLAGVRQYCGEIVQASKTGMIADIDAVNKKYDIVERQDGTFLFPINPALVQNTIPEIQAQMIHVVNGSQRALGMGYSYDAAKESYLATVKAQSSLDWLAMTLSGKTLQANKTIEIDPNPMNSLPKGWEKNIKKAEINTMPPDTTLWRGTWPEEMRNKGWGR